MYVCALHDDILCIARYTHSMTILEYKSVYNVQLEEVIISSKVLLQITIKQCG